MPSTGPSAQSLFAEYFDLSADLLYLNSGTFSITPRPVLEAMIRYQREFEKNPTASLINAWEQLWRVQRIVAEHFHTAPQNIFLRPNVTSALNDFILGIPLPRNAEILVSDLEYGAIINVCRARAERDHLSLRTLSLTGATADPDVLMDTIIHQLSSRTKLLMISHIMTGHGLVIPIRRLSEECRRREILLAIDGAHGPGATPLRFSALEELDFYGGNLHKWFLGPKGTAFGYVHPRLHESLRPLQVGWTSFEPAPPSFQKFGTDQPFARKMLHSACQNFAPYFALEDTIEFWKKQGEPMIQAEHRRLNLLLEELMHERLGWKPISPSHPELRGPFLTYALPGFSPAQGIELMRTLLTKHRLQVAVPFIHEAPCLRLSPNIYNTDQQIARAVEILAACL